MLPFGMMTDIAAGPVSAKAAGGAGANEKGLPGGKQQQFTEELQGALHKSEGEGVTEEGNMVLPAGLSARGGGQDETAGEGAAADLSAVETAELLVPNAGQAFAEVQGNAVPGSLGEAWTVTAGSGDAAGATEKAGIVPEKGAEVSKGAGAAFAGVPTTFPKADAGVSSGAGAVPVASGGLNKSAGRGSGEVNTSAAGAIGGGKPAGQSGAGLAPDAEGVSGDVAGKPKAQSEAFVPKTTESTVLDARRPVADGSAELPVGVNKSAAQAGSNEAAGVGVRRWQTGLPQELRSDAQGLQKSADPVLAKSQEEPSLQIRQAVQVAGVEPRADLEALKPQAVNQLQDAGPISKSRVWRSEPVGPAPAAEVAGVVRQANPSAIKTVMPLEGGASSVSAEPGIEAATEAQVVTAKPVQAVVGPASQQETRLAGQILLEALPRAATAPAGDAAINLEDLPLSEDRGEIRLARPFGGDLRQPGSNASALNGQASAGGAVPGQLQAGNPQMSNSAVSFGQAQFSDLVATTDAEVTGVALSAGGSQDVEPEFAASLRGGEMQGAARTEALQTPNQAQSSQVATQVAVEMARNLKNAQTRFQMRFDPPELGRVDVNMKVSADGSVQAHLIVERPETLDMFLRDQRGLERALEAAGLSADSKDLQFSLKQDSGQQLASGDDQASQDQSGQPGNGGEQASDAGAADEMLDRQLLQMTLAEQRGGLDVRI